MKSIDISSYLLRFAATGFLFAAVGCVSGASSIGAGKQSAVSPGAECSSDGATAPSQDGCNSCTCDSGTWTCTEMACAPMGGSSGGGAVVPQPGDECEEDGARTTALDGCNSCVCEAGSWACTEMACAACPVKQPEPGQDCATVITYAANPQTGECCEYSDPCSVPDGWQSYSDARCGGAAMCPEAREPEPGTACTEALVWARDPESSQCCQYNNGCAPPDGWETFGSQAACDEAAACPAPRTDLQICATVTGWSKDPDSGLCCYYATACEGPAGWEQYSTQEDCESGSK